MLSAKRISSRRAKWRSSMKSTPALKRDEYIARIQAHAGTLEKLLGQFHLYLAVWVARSQANARSARVAFPGRRVEDVLAGGRPTVNEVLALYRARDLSAEFVEYLVGKTHLSYDLAPIDPAPHSDRGLAENGPVYAKLAEFVICILAEYTMLHNYMFVSKLRDPRVRTVDKWMKAVTR